MPKKAFKQKAEYQKIPVSPETYAKVRMIADLNDRGMGDQVSAWVKQDLPECEHKKKAVSIQIFHSQNTLPGTLLERKGWYCLTCKRVYERIEAPALTPPLPLPKSKIKSRFGEGEAEQAEVVLCDGGGKA